MSGKKIITAAGMLVASFVGAGTLMQWSQSSEKNASDLKDAAQSTANALAERTRHVVVTTEKAAQNLAERTRNALKGKKFAPETAKFVELRLNANAPQHLTGRAPKGATVAALKNGIPIGTVKASDNGIWQMPLENPIMDKAYSLALQSNVGSDTSSLVQGQGADVTIGVDGRATIKIAPPVEPKLVAKTEVEAKSELAPNGVDSEPTESKNSDTTDDKKDASATANGYRVVLCQEDRKQRPQVCKSQQSQADEYHQKHPSSANQETDKNR